MFLVVGLIKKLWETAFKEQHLKSGFRACGIFPVNRQAIPANKLAPSIPHKPPPSESASGSATSQSGLGTSVAESSASTITNLPLTCHDCGKGITPVRLHVVTYFTNHFQQRNATQLAKDNRRVQPQYYGEALTRDEVLDRIEDSEREKREKEEGKAAKKREQAERKLQKEAEKEAHRGRKRKRDPQTVTPTVIASTCGKNMDILVLH